MKKLFPALFILLIILTGCKSSDRGDTAPESRVVHPEWSLSANIYEVNVRQFTDDGTLRSFLRHVPRLRRMGVDILWFMPIQPIGEENRKGPLGSYYSIKDYKEVNPEFGTFDDFLTVVSLAHDLGMKVILDWVANHTAWDHAWVTRHPEWYAKDKNGNMFYPADWEDVVQLDYNNKEMRAAMLDAMKFWVTQADIDGFRCDVAAMVPTDFWDNARKELDKIKPVFMLAEADEAELLINAFDMDYGWKLHHITNDIARKKANANDIQLYFDELEKRFPRGAYRMNFTSNHDENSWNGTVFERYGDGAQAFAVLMATLPGMPLIYTGQEAALDKRLEFFDRDPVDWKDLQLKDFYRTLNLLKRNNSALWNGDFGGALQRIATTDNEAVYAFTRTKDDNVVMVVLNLTDQPVEIELTGDDYAGTYVNVFTREKISFTGNNKMDLAPWDYYVYYR